MVERNGTQGHFLLLKMAFKSRVIPLKSMVSNIEWKIDSGCCPFLITTGGGESVQHIFTLRLSFSLGTAQIRTKQVPNYLDLLTHRQCWIKACYRLQKMVTSSAKICLSHLSARGCYPAAGLF